MKARGRPSRRGLALILVLVTIFSLSIIATPFVLSMIQQERTALGARRTANAGATAEAARNLAAVRLARGLDAAERDAGGTPYLDSTDEFAVNPRDPALGGAGLRSGRGAQWGVQAQDEQGKIHIESAPPHLMENLRRHTDRLVMDRKHFATLWSSRDSRWIHPKKIRKAGRFSKGGHWDMDKVNGYLVDRIDAIPEHLIARRVRISKPGFEPIFTRIIEICKVKPRLDLSLDVLCLVTEELPHESWENGIVEIEAAHPVNVNTARPETLAAILAGLTVYEVDHEPVVLWMKPKEPPKIPPIPHTISDEEAREAARTLADLRPFDGWPEFGEAVLRLDMLDDYKKGGVLFNALNPFGGGLVTLDGEPTGTVPFTFVSGDATSLLSLSQENLPSGVPGAQYGSWSIVDLGPPAPVERRFENQEDFETAMGFVRLRTSWRTKFPEITREVLTKFSCRFKWPAETYLGSAGPASMQGGRFHAIQYQTHPYRVMDWDRFDRTPKSEQKLLNYVMLEPARDLRLGPGVRTNHFDGHPEGWPLGHGYQVPWSQICPPEGENDRSGPEDTDERGKGKPSDDKPATTTVPGGTEFWFLLASAPPDGEVVKLLDLRERDDRNRLSVELEKGECIVRLSDTSDSGVRAAVAKGVTEVRFPHRFVPDVWFHLGVYWAGTRYGQLFVMVDGQVPDGAVWSHKIGDRTVSTQLAISLGGPAPDGSAPPTAAFPFAKPPVEKGMDWIPMLVGAEVIEYQPDTKTVRRACRGTALQEHPAGAKATLFGYGSRLRTLILRRSFEDGVECEVKLRNVVPTKGKVKVAFGKEARGNVVAPPSEDSNQAPQLTAGATKIRMRLIPDGDLADWPAKGLLRIDDEAISYSSVGQASDTDIEFRGCRRGLFGTERKDHDDGALVELWGVPVDHLDEAVAVPAILRVGQEWFGPADRRRLDGELFWSGVVLEGKARPFRGLLPARPCRVSDHEPGEPVRPAFAVREREPEIPRLNCEPEDRVTLVDEASGRETHAVHSVLEEMAAGDAEWTFDTGEGSGPMQVLTLVDTVRKEYSADDPLARLVAWPSGELLGLEWLQKENPEATYGGWPGLLDELRNLRSARRVMMPEKPVPSGAKSLKFVEPQSPADVKKGQADEDGYDSLTGLLLLGEELIGHANFNKDEKEIGPLTRGWRNTKPAVHDAGDYLFALPFLPVSALSAGAPREARHFGLRSEIPVDRLADTRVYYVQIDSEVMAFASESGTFADTLPRFDGKGLFRARFGTRADPHSADTMVFPIPFRFHDGYVEGEFERRAPLLQFSFSVRNARWDRFVFETHRQGRDAFLVPRFQVRADGRGDFWTAAVNDRSAVWHFTQDWNSLEEHRSVRGENGQIEARYAVEFLPESYWPNHSWKKTAWLDQVRIEHLRETRVLFNEER